MAKKNKTALVVGCGSETGLKVSKLLLKDGFRVIGIDSTASDEDMPHETDFIFISGDIRDLSLFNMMVGVKYVFNCAGMFDPKIVDKNRVASHFINIIGMVNLFEYGCRHGAKVIFSVSEDVMGSTNLLAAQQIYITMMADQYAQDSKLEILEVITDDEDKVAEVMVKNRDKVGSFYVDD